MIVASSTGRDVNQPSELGDQGSGFVAAGIAIGAVYFYFLIFAEFALLELARPLIDEKLIQLRSLMACLGVGGVVGSALAVRKFTLARWQSQLSWGFRACALGAVVALGPVSGTIMLLVAATCAGALGWSTVILAGGLRAVVGSRRMGVVVGVGTGTAYALCNLPWIFEASAQVQTLCAAGVITLVSMVVPSPNFAETTVGAEPDTRLRGLVGWVGILMLLVWLDSAAFYIIQHQPDLLQATWTGTDHLWANAVVHFTGAVFAGWWWDRGGRMSLVIGAFSLLAGGCLLLGSAYAQWASWCYAAGVSLYSVVLVCYPARSGRVGIAGAVYIMAGWVGSALGIGMAQDLNDVPNAFLLVAGGVILGLGLWRWRDARGIGAVVMALFLLSSELKADSVTDDSANLLRGREVYIGEGCIHCHSQYIRPNSVDENRWGRPERVDVSPPLYGNRRQGPDVATLGLRMPVPQWQREHLINPRKFNPRSRMPSYAYLFDEDGGRGEALVVYLVSLGRKLNL